MDVVKNKELVTRFSTHPLVTRVLSRGYELGFCCDFYDWKEALEKSTNPFEIGGLLEIALSRLDWVDYREILDIYLSYADGWKQPKFLWRGENGVQRGSSDRDFGSLALARKAFLALCQNVWEHNPIDLLAGRTASPWEFKLKREELEKILDFLIRGNFPSELDINYHPPLSNTKSFVLEVYNRVFDIYADVGSDRYEWEVDDEGTVRAKVLELVAQEMPRELLSLMVGSSWNRVRDEHEKVLERVNVRLNRGRGMSTAVYGQDWEIIPRVLHFLHAAKKQNKTKKKVV